MGGERVQRWRKIFAQGGCEWRNSLEATTQKRAGKFIGRVRYITATFVLDLSNYRTFHTQYCSGLILTTLLRHMRISAIGGLRSRQWTSRFQAVSSSFSQRDLADGTAACVSRDTHYGESSPTGAYSLLCSVHLEIDSKLDPRSHKNGIRLEAIRSGI